MADFKQLLAEQQRTTEALQKMEGTVQQGNKQNFIGLNTQAINQKRSEAAKVREAKKREGGQKKQTGLLATLIALGKDAKKSRVAQAAGRLTGAAKSAAKRASATANALSESIGKLRDDFRDGFEKLIPGGKDTVELLKKGLIAGAVTALIALVDTPTFKKIEDFVFEKFLPGLVSVYQNFIKPIGIFFFETFAEALNRILDFALDPSWETFKNIFQLDMPTALTVLLGAFAIFKTAAFLKSPVMLAASAIALPFKAGGFIVKSLGSLTSSFLSFSVKSTKEGFNLLQKEFSGIGTKISKLGSAIGKDVKEMILDPITNGATKLKTRVGDIGKTIGSAGKKTLLKLPMADSIATGFKALNARLKTIGDDIGKKGKGSLEKITNFGNKLFGATKGLGKLAGGVGRVALGAAKFAGPVGAVLTAGMAAFDGVSAGITEFKESGSLGSAVKEGFAGAVSGLTFGLVDQETISGGMSKIGEKGKEIFKSVTDSIFGGIKSLGKMIGDMFSGDLKFPDFSDLAAMNPFKGIADKIMGSSFFEGALGEADRDFFTISPTTFLNSVKGLLRDGFLSVFPQEPLGQSADAFQFGGNIRGGQLGLVGEAGPELFVPNRDGRIVTNTRLEAIMNNALNRATTGEGGGGATIINAPTNAVTNNSQTHSSPNAVRNNDPFFQRIAGFAI